MSSGLKKWLQPVWHAIAGHQTLRPRPPATLATQRLTLRMPRMQDAEVIYTKYAQDIDVVRYLSWPPHPEIASTREFLRRRLGDWEGNRSFGWVVERSVDRELLGMISLHPNGRQASTGYVLAREYWGQGYMTEALIAMVAFALSHPRFDRIGAICDVDNVASARVMEKAGMTRQGILFGFTELPNLDPGLRDFYSYSAEAR